MPLPPYYAPIVHAGVTYDLGHLEPFQVDVFSAQADMTLRINVVFNNHCFSASYDPALHGTSPTSIANEKPPRVFDLIRYNLSMQLPALIRGMANIHTQVQQNTSRRNWVHSVAVPTPAGMYHVFFTIRRESQARRNLQHLVMTVESAYPQQNQAGPQVLGRIGFVLLLGKVFLCKPIATRR